MKLILSISVKTILAIISLCILNSVYLDGNYSGQSRAQYKHEPYVGKADIKIEKGKIVAVKFSIKDTAKEVLFDSIYEKYYTGNALYIQQCREDWKGVQVYPAKLLETQDIDKVDAITGATWSYNIFKASVKEALFGAKKQEKEGFLSK
jgi:major membrane immunogen (membrane-anchored lipoprotein)